MSKAGSYGKSQQKGFGGFLKVAAPVAGTVIGGAMGNPMLGFQLGSAAGRLAGGLDKGKTPTQKKRMPFAPQFSPPQISRGFIAKKGGFIPLGKGAYKVTGGSHESGNDVTVPQSMAPGSNAKVEGGESIQFLKTGGQLFVKPGKGPRQFSGEVEDVSGRQKGKVPYVFSNLSVPGSKKSFSDVHGMYLADKSLSEADRRQKIVSLATLQESVRTPDGDNEFNEGGLMSTDPTKDMWGRPMSVDPNMTYGSPALNYASPQTAATPTAAPTDSGGGFLSTAADIAPFIPSVMNFGAAILAPKPNLVPPPRRQTNALVPLAAMETNIKEQAGLQNINNLVRTGTIPTASIAERGLLNAQGIRASNEYLEKVANTEAGLRNTQRQAQAKVLDRADFQDTRLGFQQGAMNTSINNADQQSRIEAVLEGGVQAAEGVQTIESNRRAAVSDIIGLYAAASSFPNEADRQSFLQSVLPSLPPRHRRLLESMLSGETSQGGTTVFNPNAKVASGVEGEGVQSTASPLPATSNISDANITSETPREREGVVEIGDPSVIGFGYPDSDNITPVTPTETSFDADEGFQIGEGRLQPIGSVEIRDAKFSGGNASLNNLTSLPKFDLPEGVRQGIPTGVGETTKQKLAVYDHARAHPNIRAFMDTVAFAEGNLYGNDGPIDNPYGVLGLRGTDDRDDFFDPLRYTLPDEPTYVDVEINGKNFSTSRPVGKFSFVDKTARRVAKKLGLSKQPLTAANQERMFMELLKERGAINDIIKGDIEKAIYKMSSQYSTLPSNKEGKGYYEYDDKTGNQAPSFDMAALLDQFKKRQEQFLQ